MASDDALLTSLCQICHIQPPKYTCPRCAQRTCSLSCSRRHKLWANCSGIRDPTVYKPISQVATPSGIDHDYNFLHGIEVGRERAVREVVERRGLVSSEELKRARAGEGEDERIRRGRGGQRGRKHTTGPRGREARGEVPLRKAFAELEIRVRSAPKQMKRNMDNATNWSKNQKCVNWTVEWIRVRDGIVSSRLLSKALDRHPLTSVYADLLEEERRKGLTEEEKRQEKKRKAEEIKARSTKKAKVGLDYSSMPAAASVCLSCRPAMLQDPSTGTWSLQPISSIASAPENTLSASEEIHPPVLPSGNSLSFYLHRPCTPSSFPKVLIPIDPTQPLSQILRRRLILDFPTIYIFDELRNGQLPDGFMFESEYMQAVGEHATSEINEEDAETSSSGDGESDSETSSSGSDNSDGEGQDGVGDERIEEGEVDPLRVYV